MRFVPLAAAVLALAAGLALGWIWLAAVGGAFTALGAYDLLQRRHSVLRNYPISGHGRSLLESIRPELQLGADYTNAARAMMMAVGCIQSQRCHTNTCPVGVATQDPKRARALDVPDKTERVRSHAELHHWLEPGELLADPPEPWVVDWARANPDSFAIA